MLPALLLALVLTLSSAGAVTVYGYQEGLAKAEENGLWGFADAAGNLAVPIQYQSVLDFTLGTARVQTGNKLGLIRQDGTYLLEPVYDTLEDLGYTVTEADHCSYRREEQASPLLRWVQYEQYPCGEGTRLPDLSYDTADVPWGWLRAWCWDRLSRYYGEGGFTETDPAPWEADLALQWEGTTGERRYLLLYGERIVFLYLGEAPTAAQRAVIVEALRG